MRLLRIIAAAAAATVLAGLALVLWALPGPAPPAGYGRAGDVAVLAAGGEPLALVPGRASRCGPWLGPGMVPPTLAAAALAAEDKRFYHHPGVDLIAIGRAARDNLMAGRVVSGGSTITMQLARLLDPGPRTPARKLREALRALWLEARLPKRRILRLYLNLAPFGGPIVGAGAAARLLLGKDVSRLAPHEAALLMALPQDPSRLLRAQNRARLRARRDRVLRAMAEAGHLSPAGLERALAAPVALLAPPPEPAAAPHLVRYLRRRAGTGRQGVIRTLIDADLQRRLNGMVAAHVKGFAGAGMRQAAVLVLRNRDLAVRAWVGSADWRAPDGQVDGVLARRQPGSALKPFLYALALERGRTLADVISDEPMPLAVDGGTHRPVDYDGESRGPVRLRVALASSLNLPALRLCASLGPPAVLARLRALGMRLPRPAEHYGVGLALGDGEVSLLELTRAYAILARGGLAGPVRLMAGGGPAAAGRVMNARAAALVTSALADDAARAPGFGRHSVLELPFPAAVKTGTSQQHRDLWCLGFTSEYTVGVWAGDFSGRPLKALSGGSAAAPLWRQVMLHLHRNAPGRLPPLPAGLVRRRVCALSGAAAGPACPAVLDELFDRDNPPRPRCPLHAPAPEPALRLTLLSPGPGGVYAMDPDLPRALQVLTLRARAAGRVRGARWRLDGAELNAGPNPLCARAPLTPGRHRVELTAWGPTGRASARADYSVLAAAAPAPKRQIHTEWYDNGKKHTSR